MNKNRVDMNCLKEALDKELKDLQLDGNVKRQILQKIRKNKKTNGGNVRWIMTACCAAVMVLYGITHVPHEDLTNAPKVFAQPEITEEVQPNMDGGYRVAIYSCDAAEGGKIFLKYDVNRKKSEITSMQDNGLPVAYGIDEVDAAWLLERGYSGKWQWVPLNSDRRDALGRNKVEKKQDDAGRVVYISKFSLWDEENRLLGEWRGDGHSLFANGIVLSSYVPVGEGGEALLRYMEKGMRNIRLRMENIPRNSTVYTEASGTVKEMIGIIEVDLLLEK